MVKRGGRPGCRVHRYEAPCNTNRVEGAMDDGPTAVTNMSNLSAPIHTFPWRESPATGSRLYPPSLGQVIRGFSAYACRLLPGFRLEPAHIRARMRSLWRSVHISVAE